MYVPLRNPETTFLHLNLAIIDDRQHLQYLNPSSYHYLIYQAANTPVCLIRT